MSQEVVRPIRLEMADRFPPNIIQDTRINPLLQREWTQFVTSRAPQEDDTYRLRTIILGRPSVEQREHQNPDHSDTTLRFVPPSTSRGVLLDFVRQNILGQFPMAIVGKGNGTRRADLAFRISEVLKSSPWAGIIGVRQSKGVIDASSPKAAEKARNILSHSQQTEGLVRYKGAQRDFEISQFLHDYGARVSIPLALLKLDPKALKQWLGSKMQGIPNSPFSLTTSVDTITSNRLDVPSLLYRFVDDVRISDLQHFKLDNAGIYSREAVIKRAADSFLAEIDFLGGLNRFFSRYNLAPVADFSNSLNQLSQGNISPKAIADYATVVAGIIGYNYGILKKVGGKIARKALGYRLQLPHIVHFQDIGITGRWHDFEDMQTVNPFQFAALSNLSAATVSIRAGQAAQFIYRYLSGDFERNPGLRVQFRRAAEKSFNRAQTSQNILSQMPK